MRTTLVVLGALALALTAPAGDASPVTPIIPKDERPVLRLRLDPVFASSWREVNVGRLVLRTPHGQERIEPPGDAGGELDLDLGGALESAGGCALVLADLGPGHSKGRPDAWRLITHATKIVACDDTGDRLAARLAAGAMATAKTGSRIELRPIANPALLRPGADLPVIAYLEGTARAGVEVVAIAPDGSRRYLETDAVGAATAAIDQSGRWRIEYRETGGDEPLAASLIFDVPTAAFWRKLEGGER